MSPRRLFVAFLICFAVARAPAARAVEADDEVEAPPAPPAEDRTPEPAPAPDRSVLQTFYPPPVDGPSLRLPESPTRLYLDGAFAQSKDLSALPYILGSGTNFRFALGGVLRWHRFSFEAEIPFAQVTTLDVTMVPGGVPSPEKQTAVSFGDIRLGAIWSERLAGEALVAGFGLRTRLATHTTHFDFYLPTNGSLVSYVFPYYFHVEPTAIVGGALGRFSYVINEGVLGLIGPNGDFLDMEVVVPTVIFWDSHVAVSWAPWDFLGASVELGSDIQVNTVNDPQFPINSVRSKWVAPALQIHAGDVRVDLIARIGFGRGTEAFGVLDYTGTSSYTLRVTLPFKD
ncbi:MAG TPA: hypothetical protein VHG72_20490 [Polyangia bacterium]|nr:hypothetical protein [Polyangia bacterium]